MKWHDAFRRCVYSLPMAAVMLLSACGGGRVETTVVAKMLEPDPLSTDGIYARPALGAAQSQADELIKMGIPSISMRCAEYVHRESDQVTFLIPSFFVLIEVASSDVERARTMGFLDVAEDWMKLHDIFDCSTKGL